MSDNWSLKGNYFESCTCDLVCPCLFLMPPTTGHCNALVGWHIGQGHLDDVKLDDLNVAVYLHAPGALTEGGWEISLYVDEGASEAQFNAVSSLWSGEHGGHLSVIAGLVSEVKSVKQVPIIFMEEDRKHYLKVGDVGENTMYEVEGADGGKVVVSNPPLSVTPGNPITVNKSEKVWYQDDGVEHSHSETVGLSSLFQYGPG